MTDTPTPEFDEAATWAEAVSSTKPATETVEQQVEREAAAIEAAADAEAGDAENQAAETEPQDEAANPPPNTAPETNPQVDDIWTDATDAQRAAFEAAISDRRQLEHRVKSDEGRVARFQRERDGALKQLSAVKSVAGHEDLEAYLASDEWTKVKTEYGDDLKPVFTALETLAARDKQHQERFGQIDQAQTATAESANFEWLNREAPDWQPLFNRPDFDPWLKAQPQSVQDMIARNFDELVDPAEVKVVASLFRADAYLADQRNNPAPADPQPKEIDRRRELQLDGARSHKSRAPILTEADPNDAGEATWAEAVAAASKLVGRR